MPVLGQLYGRVRSAFQSTDDLDQEVLAQHCQESGAEAVSACAVGSVVHVAGVVRAVTLRPQGATPVLEVEVFDGTGALTLAFLGRRRVRGVETGRSLRASGRLVKRDGRLVVFNPAYELLPPDVSLRR